MSADEAKKLIEQGLKNLQDGFAKIFEAIDDLENPDRPAPGGLRAQIAEHVKKDPKS